MLTTTPQSGYLQLLNEINRAFNFFNQYFCQGQLKIPVIMISPGEVQMYGWHGEKVWRQGETDIAEINLCAEYLCRPPEEILETLLHEMAHLKNSQNGIIDTNMETQYHYKSFRISAISLGLDVFKTRCGGWCITSLGEMGYEAIEKLNLDRSLFGMYRSLQEQQLAAKKHPKQLISLSVRSNEKMSDALEILTKKTGSKMKAVENAIMAAAYGVDFNDVI